MSKKFQLLLKPGRDNADHSEVIDKAIVETWRDITLLMAREERQIGGHTLEIHADWSVLHEYFSLFYHLFVQDPPGANGDDYDAAVKARAEKINNFKPVAVPINVEMAGNVTAAVGHSIAEYLQDVFLVANLAAPGALNLSRAKLENLDKDRSVDIRFNCGIFESAWIDALRLSYPPVRQLKVEDVLRWFRKLEFGKRQLAEKGPVKALFCLLHLAEDWELEPTALLWISHGLEGLYSVPNALSFNFLRERLTLLLEADAGQKQHLAKGIRALYDMRNAFAHGGMSIARPQASEVIDPRVDDTFERLLNNRDFGARLLVASLQSMIQRELCELEFKETLCVGAA